MLIHISPDREYRFLWDRKARVPACPLLQALYGGDREVCFEFQNWQINIVDFIWVKATGKEIEKCLELLENTPSSSAVKGAKNDLNNR